MIAWVRRVFRRPGGQRDRDAGKQLHAIRSLTQVMEAERFIIHRQRERQDIADALARTRPPWRQGADQP